MPTKPLASNNIDDLRPEYTLASLKGVVRGKYYARAAAGITLVFLEPDVAEAFPDGPAVNRALRTFLRTERGQPPNEVPRPTSRARPRTGSRKTSRASRG